MSPRRDASNDASAPEPGRLAIIVAAGGHGVRLKGNQPKQYVDLLGVPMVQRTIAALDSCKAVDRIVVVVNAEDVDYCHGEIVAERFSKVVAVVGGGEERAFSVRNGFNALRRIGATEFVGVHDGARPLVRCEEITRARARLAAAATLAGVVLAVPSVDTLKRVDAKGLVVETPERGRFWRAQTPQIFRWERFAVAYDQPDSVLAAVTDDSSLVEATGGRVVVVEGSPDNLKITDPGDVRAAEQILAARRR
ncbi:MAG: 2-C-methyl-D-erythritol 4-phosphate cytidylyltransferase [Actinobacteria bacterium]|nr:2-C-methyl-D-erythritol 4-phosphate cytidylyltransferase [Actinomycetota bacterium]